MPRMAVCRGWTVTLPSRPVTAQPRHQLERSRRQERAVTDRRTPRRPQHRRGFRGDDRFDDVEVAPHLPRIRAAR